MSNLYGAPMWCLYVVTEQTEQDVAGLREAAKIARTALELTCKLAAVIEEASLEHLYC